MPPLKLWSNCFKLKEKKKSDIFYYYMKSLSRLKAFSMVHKLALWLTRVSTASEISAQHSILQYNTTLMSRKTWLYATGLLKSALLTSTSDPIQMSQHASKKKILQCYWLALEIIYRKVFVEVWKRKTTHTNLKGILQKRLIYFHQVLHQKYLQRGCWLDESHQVLKRTEYSS